MGMVIQEIEVRPKRQRVLLSMFGLLWRLEFQTHHQSTTLTSAWLVNIFLTNYLAASDLIEIKSRLD